MIDVAAFAEEMGNLGFPLKQYRATGLGIDLDINLHNVFSKQFNVEIQYDPMHLDRALWRK